MVLHQTVSLAAALLAVLLWHFPLLVLAGLAAYLVFRKWGSPIYLLDFKCYSPPASFRQPVATFEEHVFLDDRLDLESKHFLCKILKKSGFSDEIAVPPSSAITPIRRSLAFALEEATCVIFTMVRDLLSGNGISPRAIDILVCNSSMFSPTPSLTAMVVNEFKMRSNILSYNLSGMGCSAGIVSIALTRDVLRARRNSLALLVNTEVLNMNWYVGKNPSMLMTNCLFRMGGAALLMSSREIDKHAAKYELQHLVRTNNACNDQSYTCVYQDVDSEKKTGVSISKEIVSIAGDILKANMVKLGPSVLPYSEQCRYIWSTVIKRLRMSGKREVHVPNFKKAFKHFCIHAGGRAVIEAIEKNLQLNEEDVEASKMTLHKFGNTSSSSIWYELAYLETKGRIKRGDKIWQIAFGSGFKCNSAVWKCRLSIQTGTANAWKGKIETDPTKLENPL